VGGVWGFPREYDVRGGLRGEGGMMQRGIGQTAPSSLSFNRCLN